MDAVKFLTERRRICRDYEDCSDCPLDLLSCNGFGIDEFTDLVSAVEKWSAEHPVKTRLQDFMEKYPNAPTVGHEKMPLLRPAALGYCETISCRDCKYYPQSDVYCWNLPLEE